MKLIEFIRWLRKRCLKCNYPIEETYVIDTDGTFACGNCGYDLSKKYHLK